MRTYTMTVTLAMTLFISLAVGTRAQLPDLQGFPDVPIACFGGITLVQAPDFQGFPDVPKNHWAFEAVTDLARRGIVQGYPAEGSGDKLKAKPVTKTNTAVNTKTTPKRATKSHTAR